MSRLYRENVQKATSKDMILSLDHSHSSDPMYVIVEYYRNFDMFQLLNEISIPEDIIEKSRALDRALQCDLITVAKILASHGYKLKSDPIYSVESIGLGIELGWKWTDNSLYSIFCHWNSDESNTTEANANMYDRMMELLTTGYDINKMDTKETKMGELSNLGCILATTRDKRAVAHLMSLVPDPNKYADQLIEHGHYVTYISCIRDELTRDQRILAFNSIPEVEVEDMDLVDMLLLPITDDDYADPKVLDLSAMQYICDHDKTRFCNKFRDLKCLFSFDRYTNDVAHFIYNQIKGDLSLELRRKVCAKIFEDQIYLVGENEGMGYDYAEWAKTYLNDNFSDEMTSHEKSRLDSLEQSDLEHDESYDDSFGWLFIESELGTGDVE